MKGKCLPIKITNETQEHIARYKQRLLEMSENDEIGEIDKKIVYIVFNKLSAYECNILCAYYDLADCSSTKLGNLLGISPGVAAARVKSINNKIKKMLEL